MRNAYNFLITQSPKALPSAVRENELPRTRYHVIFHFPFGLICSINDNYIFFHSASLLFSTAAGYCLRGSNFVADHNEIEV